MRHEVYEHHRRGRERGGAERLSDRRRRPASAGHLLETEFPDAYRNWQTTDQRLLLTTAPVLSVVPEKNLPLAAMLKAEARNAAWLILWLDCDREGEAIAKEARAPGPAGRGRERARAREGLAVPRQPPARQLRAPVAPPGQVMDVCLSSHAGLRVLRARFSALTPADVWRAVGPQLGLPDANAAAAVALRQEIDLRLGAAFTRFQTLALQHCVDFGAFGRDNGKGPMLSYGPCQFPTLGFIVRRFWEVGAHVEERFWSISFTHSPGGGRPAVPFSWQRGRLFDRAAAAALYAPCAAAPTAAVLSCGGGAASRRAPLPLNTLEMQKRFCQAARNVSPEAVMQQAEALYQTGFISYPRTETNSFPPDLDLAPLVQAQASDPRWGGYAQTLLGGRMRAPAAGGSSDGAHPPIYPVRAGDPDMQHAPLYAFIARHFLACVSPDAAGEQSRVVADVAGEAFTASGLAITDPGYLLIYGAGPSQPGGPPLRPAYDGWGVRGAAALPPYRPGERFPAAGLRLTEGRTTGPRLLTETELLTEMDRHKIGTDATQARRGWWLGR